MYTNLFMKSWSDRETAEFAAQMERLLGSGIPLLHSIDIASRHAGLRRKQLMRVKEKIESGETLHEAFHEIRFPYLFISYIGIAELHGSLQEAFSVLARWYGRKDMFRKTMVQKLSYPAFLLLFMFVLLTYFIAYLMPRFQELLNTFQVELPHSTRTLFLFLDYIRSNFLFMIAGSFTLILLIWTLGFLLNKKNALFPLLHRLPLLGSMLRVRNTYFFASQMGLLLEAGYGFWEALQDIRKHTPYRSIQFAIDELIDHISLGNPLSTATTKTPWFHKDLYRLCAFGETEGTLGSHILMCSTLMEQMMELWIRRCSKWIEPIILLNIGFFIALVTISLISPILQVIQGI